MPVFHCPECLAKIKYPASAAGTTKECPGCRKPVRVPPESIGDEKKPPPKLEETRPRKIPALAVALGMLLGPLGLLYVSWQWALIVLVIQVFAAVLIGAPEAVMLGILPCAIIASVAAHSINGEKFKSIKFGPQALPTGLIIGGVVGAILFGVADTTVSAGSLGRVYNTGLQAQQLIGVIISCVAILSGVILLAVSKRT